jgi:hypothetical protein
LNESLPLAAAEPRPQPEAVSLNESLPLAAAEPRPQPEAPPTKDCASPEIIVDNPAVACSAQQSAVRDSTNENSTIKTSAPPVASMSTARDVTARLSFGSPNPYTLRAGIVIHFWHFQRMCWEKYTIVEITKNTTNPIKTDADMYVDLMLNCDANISTDGQNYFEISTFKLDESYNGTVQIAPKPDLRSWLDEAVEESFVAAMNDSVNDLDTNKVWVHSPPMTRSAAAKKKAPVSRPLPIAAIKARANKEARTATLTTAPANTNAGAMTAAKKKAPANANTDAKKANKKAAKNPAPAIATADKIKAAKQPAIAGLAPSVTAVRTRKALDDGGPFK